MLTITFRTISRLLLLIAIGLVAACSTVPKPVEPTAPPVTESGELVIAAVGDIMIDGSAREIMQRYGYDHAFAGTRDWLQQADIAIGNLEGPLTTRGTAVNEKQYLFRSPPDLVVPAMVRAGFDIVTLANNHTLDFGDEGLIDTINALKEGGIAHVGAGPDLASARRAAVIERNGLKAAFLGYSLTFPEEFWATSSRGGTAFGHLDHVVTDVRAARQIADIVVVSFHWGRESTTELRPYQIALGRSAIDAGAQLVIGHHPHILQAVEKYKQGVILYSLGNFAFGSYSEKARVSAVAEIKFRKQQLVQLTMKPINVLNVQVLFQPTPLAGKEAHAVINQLQQLSSQRNTGLVARHDSAILELSPTVSAEIKN